jgi:hypothetical protein
VRDLAADCAWADEKRYVVPDAGAIQLFDTATGAKVSSGRARARPSCPDELGRRMMYFGIVNHDSSHRNRGART